MVGVFASSGVVVALMSDVGVLMTTEEAAKLCQVQPVTIRQWVRRGHLTPVGREPGGRSLMFRQVDVAGAERKTRGRAGRDLSRTRAA